MDDKAAVVLNPMFFMICLNPDFEGSSLDAMELSQVLRKRRMIRHFKPEPISDDILRKVINAGNSAPTTSNASYRRLMLIKDPRILRLFRDVAPGYTVSQAAAIIIVYTDLNVASAGENKTHVPWSSRMDAGAAAENIHLAAVDMGLGSCFFSSSSQEGIKELLDFPAHCRPEIMVSLGYPMDGLPKPRKASSEAKVVYVDKFGRRWDT